MHTSSEIVVTILIWGLLAVGLAFALRARRRRRRAAQPKRSERIDTEP